MSLRNKQTLNDPACPRKVLVAFQPLKTHPSTPTSDPADSEHKLLQLTPRLRRAYLPPW